MEISALKEEISKGMRAYKAFSEGEKTLQALVGIEQNEKEIKARIEKLRVEEAEFNKSVSELPVIIAKAKEEAVSIRAVAAAAVAAMKKNAEVEIAELRRKTDEDLAEVNEAVAAKQDELSGLQDAIKSAKAELAELTAQRNDTLAKLRSILKG